jgi:hypothetical protein
MHLESFGSRTAGQRPRMSWRTPEPRCPPPDSLVAARRRRGLWTSALAQAQDQECRERKP